MRSRLATGATLLVLLAGTGGAIALGEAGSSGGGQGGAATAQYKPGKGCGDKNHRHKKKHQCKAPKHHKKSKKPKQAHKPAPKKSHPRSTNCKFRLIGQTLTAYCPLH